MQIDIRGLTKTYTTWNRGSTFAEVIKSLVRREKTEVQALRGIDLSIGAGELVGFLGPNGAGKSTMLKILTGVLYPTSGEVSVMGVCPWKDRKRYVAGIGAVFGQKSQLVWDIPPVDSFMMNQAIYRIPDAEFRRTMDRLTDMLSVREQMKQPTRNLSLGERMKCEFIMAMLHKPRVVFLDEPTIGLDVIAKDRIRAFIQEMNRDGVTFILTTHDLDDVERLARRVIVINHGSIVFDDGIASLRGHFGAKKIVTAACASPCFISADGAELPLPRGVSLQSRLSAADVVLECDTAVMDLPSLIRLVSETYGLRDLAVEDVPIETVIKELYARD